MPHNNPDTLYLFIFHLIFFLNIIILFYFIVAVLEMFFVLHGKDQRVHSS